MTKISATDIDQIDMFGEFFQRAICAPETVENPEQRLADAQAIIDNILKHAESMIDYTADNVAIALGTVHRVLGQAVSTLEQAELGASLQTLSELKRTANSFDPSRYPA